MQQLDVLLVEPPRIIQELDDQLLIFHERAALTAHVRDRLLSAALSGWLPHPPSARLREGGVRKHVPGAYR